jgi:hypothetical protein
MVQSIMIMMMRFEVRLISLKGFVPVAVCASPGQENGGLHV